MHSERKGELFLFSSSFMWSFFPILTILSLSTLGPLISLAFTVVFATLFFLALIVIRKRWHELTDRKALKDILLGTFFIGVLFYSLFFYGMQFTTVGNASLVSLLETFFSFLFFNVFRKEYISRNQIIGALLMLAGAVIVLFPETGSFTLNKGDFFIMLAVAVPPLGNFFQRRARERVSSETILFLRSLISAPIIIVLALVLGETIDLQSLSGPLPFLILNGVLLFGLSKIFWIEGIHRVLVTKGNAIGGIRPLLTLLFAFLILGEVPTMFQLLSFIPLFFGVLLITRKKAESHFASA